MFLGRRIQKGMNAKIKVFDLTIFDFTAEFTTRTKLNIVHDGLMKSLLNMVNIMLVLRHSQVKG